MLPGTAHILRLHWSSQVACTCGQSQGEGRHAYSRHALSGAACTFSSAAEAAHAQVIFLFGEIDCREGLLLAVGKLKYDSVDEAMDVLADIYVGVLTRLVEERDLTAYMHPVPPVLNETRHIVMPFNAVVKKKVRGCMSQGGFCDTVIASNIASGRIPMFMTMNELEGYASQREGSQCGACQCRCRGAAGLNACTGWISPRIT